MKIVVTYAKETKNYVNYESADMDFSHSEIKCKLWIPKSELQTNIPGVWPVEIELTIMDDSQKSEGVIPRPTPSLEGPPW